MNIDDIARKAGVSTATVSRTLNGSPLVLDKTAERIRAIIEKAGYFPNGSARTLRSGRSNLFGVIISDITNPFFPDLISRFEKLSMEHSYEVIFANTSYDTNRLEHSLSRMMERRVDGIAIFTSEMHQAAISMLRRQSIPTVCLQYGEDNSGFSNIAIDHTIGLRQAVEHLINLGHRDIAFIAGPATLWSANRRREIMLAELNTRQLKLPPAWLTTGDHTILGGFEAMNGLLKLKKRPTAILCSNDLMALGALKAITESGLTVPRDFSLIGIDDLEISAIVNPPLTTIRIPRLEIATQAFLTLLAASRASRQRISRRTVETNLVVRNSTSPPGRPESAR